MSDAEITALAINPIFYIIAMIGAFNALWFLTEANKAWREKTLTWGELLLILAFTFPPVVNAVITGLAVVCVLFFGVVCAIDGLIIAYKTKRPLAFLYQPIRR